jgi:hypothetical protein
MSAVVLIIIHKVDPSANELKSLMQCAKVLSKYRIVMICPRGLDVRKYQEAVPHLTYDFIDPKWHSSYRMFNRLKIAPLLYRRYKKFEYILFYELDAWVFRDELQYWCDQDYDYIGAPWFQGWDVVTEDARFIGIGNGGFSLRKIEGMLKVLHTFRYVRAPGLLLKEFRNSPLTVKSFFTLVKNLTVRNNFFFLFNDYSGNEDGFWGGKARKNFKWLKFPEQEIAIKFSMETKPETLYKLNNYQLPFGCHKWEKYNPMFWNTFIKN